MRLRLCHTPIPHLPCWPLSAVGFGYRSWERNSYEAKKKRVSLACRVARAFWEVLARMHGLSHFAILNARMHPCMT